MQLFRLPISSPVGPTCATVRGSYCSYVFCTMGRRNLLPTPHIHLTGSVRLIMRKVHVSNKSLHTDDENNKRRRIASYGLGGCNSLS